MEKLFRLLPGPQPFVVRYGATALFVLVAYGIRIALGNYTGAYGFLFFILPIVASALMFDRGTGFFAVGLSTVLVASVLEWGERTGPHVVALLIFVLVGSILVFLSEGLHRALEEAHNAQRAASLLLDEMSHRVKNKFAMISSIVSLQARRSSPEVRAALEDIGSRVNIIATVHNFLQLSRHQGQIDMSVYVPGLCDSLSKALCGPRPISLTSQAVAEELPPEKALAIGVIINELVTNAFKYAFDDSKAGHIHVELSSTNDSFELSVADNGRGFASDREAGLGTRLVTMFAAQLGGSASWDSVASGGCKITIVFPRKAQALSE
jgi:two-component sensor histidine kinase